MIIMKNQAEKTKTYSVKENPHFVKKSILKGDSLVDVLDEVIDRCIEQGILKDILIKQRGEVRSMV